MRKTRFSTWLAFLSLIPATGALAASTPTAAAPGGAGAVNCTTTREFVTTLEFLRDRKDLAVPEKDARVVAERVAAGCNGAARRFIRVTSLLSKAGLTGTDAIRQGEELASRTDAEAESFATVFEKAFLSEYLDLDLSSALKMARSLSTGFEGDVSGARSDFEKLVEFCVSSRSLALPKPECGAFAMRLAREGQRWSGGLAGPFIQAFDFMTTEPSGPRLSTRDALRLAEDLTRVGPGAAENFTQAYRYGVSKSGLSLSDQDALGFARKMASLK